MTPDESTITYTVERILSWAHPLSWITAARRIETFNPDVTVIPWWTFFWYPWFAPLLRRLRRLPRVVIAHNTMDHEQSGIRGTISRRASSHIFKLADRVIVQSTDEEHHARKLGARNTIVVHHPVYPQFSSSIPKDAARRYFGLSPDAKVALLFGAVRSYKGADLFAEAVASLPHITGIIAGEIWDRTLGEHLKKKATIAPNLLLLDRYFDDEEGRFLFAACDTVVLPYRSVTGSGAAMAALGAGKPIIAADLPLFRELFPSPVATFFAPGDSSALARAIATFFSLSPRNDNMLLSESLRGIILARFGWNRLVAAITTVTQDTKDKKR